MTDDEIDWDVVPPPPTSAFDRLQTRTVRVARSGRRRLPETRRAWLLTGGIVLVMLLALVATWWVRRPPPGADRDLLARLATTAETFTPSFVTSDPTRAEGFVVDVYGWTISLPRVDGFRLEGAGEAMLAPQLSVPAFRYAGPDGEPVVVYAYDYAFLNEVQATLDLPEATYAQLAEPVSVDARRLDGASIVSWRRRAVIYTAVTDSDDAFELVGQAARAIYARPDSAAAR